MLGTAMEGQVRALQHYPNVLSRVSVNIIALIILAKMECSAIPSIGLGVFEFPICSECKTLQNTVLLRL